MRRCREVDFNLLHIVLAEIVDRYVVGAAQGLERNALDIVEVHGDGGDVAGQHCMAAIGGDGDILADVGAVELQRVEAVASVDDIAAVARVPDKRVIAGAEQRVVVAAPADDEVVTIAADQRVVSVAAGDAVVAGTAVDGELDESGETVSGGDDVIAAAGVENEVLG